MLPDKGDRNIAECAPDYSKSHGLRCFDKHTDRIRTETSHCVWFNCDIQELFISIYLKGNHWQLLCPATKWEVNDVVSRHFGVGRLLGRRMLRWINTSVGISVHVPPGWLQFRAARYMWRKLKTSGIQAEEALWWSPKRSERGNWAWKRRKKFWRWEQCRAVLHTNTCMFC